MSDTKTTPNGQVRKSLASQIDRLDTILDGLSEGLNEAVAAAVQQASAVAVREAVQGALTELVTNPDVLALFRALGDPAAPPAAGPCPGRGLHGRTWDGLKARVQQVFRNCAACLRKAGQCLQAAWQLRSKVVAVLLGMAAALWTYLAWPRLAELAGRLGEGMKASAPKANTFQGRPAWTPSRG